MPLHHSLTSVGGLELSIKFSHRTDRERILSSARILGWKIEGDNEEYGEDEEQGDTAPERMHPMTFSLIMPKVWLPVHCLLLPGHTELQRSTYCYYRYKLYDQEAFCSELRHPALEDGEEGEGMATVAFLVTLTIELKVSQSLLWYLREERLEVQLWVSFSKEKLMRPHKLDRLVGSAFVDLSSITASKHKQTISGTVIFMFITSNLTLTPCLFLYLRAILSGTFFLIRITRISIKCSALCVLSVLPINCSTNLHSFSELDIFYANFQAVL